MNEAKHMRNLLEAEVRMVWAERGELKLEAELADAKAKRQHILELLGQWFEQGISLSYSFDGGWWCRRCDAGEAERQADVPHEPNCLWWRTGQALRMEEQP